MNIQTRDNTVKKGNYYLYFDSTIDENKPIAMVELVEDFSDENKTQLMFDVSVPMSDKFEKNVSIICTSDNKNWHVKDSTVENILSALGPPSEGSSIIPKIYVQSICKIGQGSGCCRYLIMGSKGFECAKTESTIKDTIDKRASAGEMIAVGINCNGFNIP